MKIGSLCTGYGGLDIAVHNVLGGEMVWYSEFDKHPSALLEQRFPGIPNLGDLTAIYWHSVEPVDVLTGGYPCQPFSNAGKRLGENDPRHLWPYIREAIRVLRPKLTILENVAGHRSRGFSTVLRDCAEDGLSVRWVSVRASDAGAPHRRERLFFVVTHADSAERGEPRLAFAGKQEVPAADFSTSSFSDQLSLFPTPSTHDATGPRSLATLQNTARPFSNLNDAVVHLLPTPEAKLSRSGPDYARMSRPGSGGHDLVTAVAIVQSETADMGKYMEAVRRWESITRPAPAPTESNTNGKPRLAAPFVEWMMGLPEGWVTDESAGIPRTAQLKLLGNGVVPQQAEIAIRTLLSDYR